MATPRTKITVTIHPDTKRIISTFGSEAMQKSGAMHSMAVGEALDMLACFWVFSQTSSTDEKAHYGALLEEYGVELPRSTASIRG